MIRIQEAYSCVKCGIINVFDKKYSDGNRCMKCGGMLVPMGDAITFKKHTREMTVKVNIDTKDIDQAINKCEVFNEQLSKTQEILSNPYFVQAFKIDEKFEQFNELILKPGAKGMGDIVDAIIHSIRENDTKEF